MGTLLLMAAWFAVLTGLIEGVGLLLFQRVNAARWGPMLHVSEPIVWISVVVDLILFSIIAIAIAGVSRFVPRLRPIRIAAFLLSSAAAY